VADPTTGILDAFGDVSQPRNLSVWNANWSSGGLFAGEWQTNATGASSTGTNSGDGWDISYGPDSEIYCTLSAKPTDGQYIALYLRCTDFSGGASQDGYEMELDPVAGTDTITVYRIDNGVFTAVTPNPIASQEFSVGDGFFYEIIGSTHKAYRRSAGVWSQIGSNLTEATYPAAGLIGLQGSGQIDDFGGGTVVVGGSTTPTATGFPRRGMALAG
jgi:hypothetical protein